MRIMSGVHVAQGFWICRPEAWYIGKCVSRLRGSGPKPAGKRHRQFPDEGHDRSGSFHEVVNPLFSGFSERLLVRASHELARTAVTERTESLASAVATILVEGHTQPWICLDLFSVTICCGLQYNSNCNEQCQHELTIYFEGPPTTPGKGNVKRLPVQSGTRKSAGNAISANQNHFVLSRTQS